LNYSYGVLLGRDARHSICVTMGLTRFVHYIVIELLQEQHPTCKPPSIVFNAIQSGQGVVVSNQSEIESI